MSRPLEWSDAQTNTLCQLIADGHGFADAARVLPYSQRQCSDRFKTIRRGYGWQSA